MSRRSGVHSAVARRGLPPSWLADSKGIHPDQPPTNAIRSICIHPFQLTINEYVLRSRSNSLLIQDFIPGARAMLLHRELASLPVGPKNHFFTLESHCCNCTPFNSSRRVGMQRAMKGSSPILGGKSDVVVMMPFDASRSPFNTPSSARTAS